MLAKLNEKRKVISGKVAETFAIMKEVNSILKGINRIYVIWKWMGATFSAVTPLAKYLLVGVSFQKVSESVIESGGVSRTLIYILVLAFAGYVLVSAVISIYRNYQETIFDNNLDDALEEMIIKHLSDLDLARLSDPEFIELKDNAENRGTSAVRRIFEIQLGVISNIIALVFSVGAISFINPYLLLLLILPVIPRFLRAIKIDKKSRDLWESQHATRRRKRLFAQCLNDSQMLIMMRLLNFGTFIRSFYHQYMMQLRTEQNQLTKYRRDSNLWMLIPGQAVGIIMLLILLQQVFGGSISITAMFVVAGSLEQFPQALFGVLNTGVELRSSALDYEYLQKLLATKAVINETDAKDKHFDKCPDIKVDSVSFQYPNLTAYAVRECTLQISQGEKIAIVGKNGSGKTTLARLLGKVYLSTTGSILVDQQDIAEITQRSWINHALYLGQRFRPLELTIDYAITGGILEGVDKERFRLATLIAGTDEFVVPLKDGYKTQIGEQWPEGIGFSGGQIQRLALASSLYRLLEQNVWVGIFDEPMSDCDIQTRERFYKSITRDIVGKTIIVIAHDPFYLHFFDRVIVMDHGRVINDLRGDEIKDYQAEVLPKEA